MFTLENTKDATHVYWSTINGQWLFYNLKDKGNMKWIDPLDFNWKRATSTFKRVKEGCVKLKRKKKDKKKFFNVCVVQRPSSAGFVTPERMCGVVVDAIKQAVTEQELFDELSSIVERNEVLGNRAMINALSIAIQSNKLPGVTFKA